MLKKSCFLLAALATGCIAPEVTEKGPTLHVMLDPTGFPSATTDTDSDPHITLGTTDTMYEFDLIVDTRDGQIDNAKTGSEDQPVTMITGTLTMPGQTLMAGPFDMPTGSDRTFKRMTPIQLPASVKTMTLKVQFTGECANGLASNVIDFNVAFR